MVKCCFKPKFLETIDFVKNEVLPCTCTFTFITEVPHLANGVLVSYEIND